MKKLFSFLSILMVLVTACEEDKPEPSQKNIAGVYKITALKARPDGGTEIDVFGQLNECQKNDTWDFQENGTFRYGGTQTSTCQSEDFSGTWSLGNGSFTIAGPTNTTTYRLEKFEGSFFVLSTAGTLNGDPARFYVTYSKR